MLYEVITIVGESGCGKSTLIKTLIGLEDSTSGEAKFLGFDITDDISKRDENLIKELQMVFQNPDSTMNPSRITSYNVCYTKLLRLFSNILSCASKSTRESRRNGRHFRRGRFGHVGSATGLCNGCAEGIW